jgi:hypothetical protein
MDVQDTKTILKTTLASWYIDVSSESEDAVADQASREQFEP